MKNIFGGHSKKAGVYKITNTKNGRIYIGSCKCFKVRANQHLNALRQCKHQNKFIQADFNKHGTSTFLFEIIETVNGDRFLRTQCEQKYLDLLYDNQKKCYNIKKYSIQIEGPWNLTPKETGEKISKALAGRKLSEKHKKKLSDIHKKLGTRPPSALGKKRSKETKRKMSEAAKERFKNPENHPWFGKNHSKESKIKMSEIRKNKIQKENDF